MIFVSFGIALISIRFIILRIKEYKQIEKTDEQIKIKRTDFYACFSQEHSHAILRTYC